MQVHTAAAHARAIIVEPGVRVKDALVVFGPGVLISIAVCGACVCACVCVGLRKTLRRLRSMSAFSVVCVVWERKRGARGPQTVHTEGTPEATRERECPEGEVVAVD
jgi:hypothetical protein